MGDRANIVIKDNDSQVWLYGHWGGDTYITAVHSTLNRHARWNDAPYLARMLFDAYTDGTSGQETGFGIDTSMGDNEHPIIVVDVALQSVYFVKEKNLEGRRIPDPDNYTPAQVWTFQTFSELAPDHLPSGYTE